ncbi:hypothetical protein NEHOM01_0779 [Nematocida homosporus]|uniref:uncharacterized protein n=1 Tax=Nematocida homosporus TaxID=1912981 RepID=UPI00221FA00E|nr:uncharacterized protein NEHOM01_0779 [Nematocida homosporus]KAI5185364.1 hypothetical protein NEHOM01_0779 [Nematocida homosporus]
MQDEFYIVESLGISAERTFPITGMRIVEISNQMVHSEVLVDSQGLIPIFTIIDKRSSEVKKGIIVIERRRNYPIKEYILEKESNPQGLAIKINNAIYVLKFRVTAKQLMRVEYREGRLLMHEDIRTRGGSKEVGSGTEIYPQTEREDILQEWSSAPKGPETSITTTIINTKDSVLYMLVAGGWQRSSGVEKYSSIVLLTETLTRSLVLQTLSKYNHYLSTGLKEIVTAELSKRRKKEESYLLKDAQIGEPLLDNRPFFFDMIYHILLEHRIVIVSQEEDLLVNYVQGLLASIQPYEWRGIMCVPLLNCPTYTKLVEATIPYLIGIKGGRSQIKEMMQRIPEKTIIAYLDESLIVVHKRTKEAGNLFGPLGKSREDRREIPFYPSLGKNLSFTWPELKMEMNIFMEIISTQACTAREKVIRGFVLQKKTEELKSFLNNLLDCNDLMLSHLKKHARFYQEFLDTSLYQKGIANEYIREVKEEGLEAEEMVTILWLCIYTTERMLHQETRVEEVQFVLEAYLKRFVERSFVATEALVINLLSILSSINSYGMVMYICEKLKDLGICLTQEMCAALVPVLSTKVLSELKCGLPSVSPWRLASEAAAKLEAGPKESTPDSVLVEIWNKMGFVGSKLVPTLLTYVCTTRVDLLAKDPETLQLLSAEFDRYELVV